MRSITNSTTFKSLNKVTSLLLLFQFLTRLGFFISIPYLAFYLSYLHYSKIMVGITVAAQPLFYSMGSLLLGFLADRYGKKNIMVIATFFMALTSLAIAHVSTFLGYFIFNALLGMSRSLFDAAMPAYLTDITATENHRLVFNLRFLITNLASAIGPVIGVYFANRHSSSVFDISAFIYFLSTFILYKTLTNDYKKQTQQTAKQFMQLKQIFFCLAKDKCLLAITLGTMIYYLVYAQLEAPFAQALLILHPHHATWLFGLLWVINSLVIAIFQLPLVWITEKVSLKLLNYIGVGFTILCFLGLAFFLNEVALIICVLLLTIGEMLISPLSNIVIAKIAPTKLRSTYFGASSLAFFGIALAPVSGSALLQYGNTETLFLAMAVLCFTIAICYHYALRLLKEGTTS